MELAGVADDVFGRIEVGPIGTLTLRSMLWHGSAFSLVDCPRRSRDVVGC
jgi:hypothetical protein